MPDCIIVGGGAIGRNGAVVVGRRSTGGVAIPPDTVLVNRIRDFHFCALPCALYLFGQPDREFPVVVRDLPLTTRY